MREKKNEGSALYQLHKHKFDYKFIDNQFELIYPIDEVQTTLVRLEVVADQITWVRTLASGKIDFIDLKKMDEGNSLELKVILVNTDDI